MGFRSLVAFAFLILLSAGAWAQAPQTPRTGVLQGTITTQGTVRLPGAEVVVSDSADTKVATILSDENGHFSVVGLAPGRYKVTATLASFVTTAAVADVAAGRSSDLTIDLPVQGIAENVNVTAASP